MKPGAAETAPLHQKLDETNQPKPGAIAAAVRQAKRGVGVFGVALALSGVLVAVLDAPDTTKRFELQMDATTPAATSADDHHDDASRQEGVDRSFYPPFAAATKRARLLPLPSRRLRGVPRDP